MTTQTTHETPWPRVKWDRDACEAVARALLVINAEVWSGRDTDGIVHHMQFFAEQMLYHSLQRGDATGFCTGFCGAGGWEVIFTPSTDAERYDYTAWPVLMTYCVNRYLKEVAAAERRP